ncbi:orexin receptor type 2-like [Ischnura elegans]|uniref:orexin receptor type 2-like n=1 Tax=Ischnura elegans TaxID=197161 RepID=UPI001ED8AADC|nr:orexin receptor type 2-like [Ischnura elegans]
MSATPDIEGFDGSSLSGGAASSYLFGNDTGGGWGPRFFFTFYSEFPSGGSFDSVGTATAVELTALLATLAASLATNGAVVWAVLWRRRSRRRHGGSVTGSGGGGSSTPRGLRPSVTDAFLLNLAAADLVFALGIPLVAFTRVTKEWRLGETACRILPYSQFVCGFVLLWTLALISMDRHRCIAVPPYRSRLTPRTALGLSAAVWFLALTIFIPVPFWFRQQTAMLPASYHSELTDGIERATTTICTVVFPREVSDRLPIPLSLCFTIPVLTLAVFIPMALLVYHYHRIFREVAATRSRWRRRLPSLPCTAPTPMPSDDNSQRRDSDMSFVGIWAAGLPWRKNSTFLQSRGSVVSQAAPSSAAATQAAQQREEARLRRHLRVVRLLLLNVGVVVAMWLPIAVIALLIYVDGRRPNEDTGFFLRAHHFLWALAAALLNTVVNPLLYGLLSHPFRRACRAGVWRAALCCGGKSGGRRRGCFSAETAAVVGAGACLGGGDLKGRRSTEADVGDFGGCGAESRTPTGSALLIGFAPHTPGGSSRGCGRSSGSVASGPEGSTGD